MKLYFFNWLLRILHPIEPIPDTKHFRLKELVRNLQGKTKNKDANNTSELAFIMATRNCCLIVEVDQRLK